jgi:hypothetical protein
VGELRLRVTVPADQAPGVYQAIVISSVEYSRGIVLTLTVHAEGPGPE